MNKSLFLRSLAVAGLMSVSMVGFAAPQDTPTTPPASTAPMGMAAHVRIIHASPDAPAVDVLLDGNKALTNVAFKTVSDYLPVPAGTHQVKVVATGTDTAVIDAPVTVKAGGNYTILAIGRASDSSIKPLVLTDITPKSVKNKAAVRVVYAIPDGPPVDLVIPQTKSGSPVYIAKALTTGTASAYLTAPAGAYSVEVRPAGGSTSVRKIDIQVVGGGAYTVVAFGLVSDAANIEARPVADMTMSVKKTVKMNKKVTKATKAKRETMPGETVGGTMNQ